MACRCLLAVMLPRTPLCLDGFPTGLVWRGNTLSGTIKPGCPSGFPQLDEALPGGGWPRGVIIELLCDQPGIGEITLLHPFLRLTPAGRWMLWVAPPWQPYAPALASLGLPLSRLLLIESDDRRHQLWSTRVALSSGACHAVLAWLDRIDTPAMRRLQLAAEASGTAFFLFRHASAARDASPAALRLQLEPAHDGLNVRILKRRGARIPSPVRIPLPFPAFLPTHGLARDTDSSMRGTRSCCG